MSFQYLLYETGDHIATITLNRPERMNALLPDMYDEILQALDQADADPQVRVIIFTGAGKCFCSGQDLNTDNKFGQKVENIEDYRDRGGLISLRIYDLRKPCIGALNGSAVGVGITMTLPMDFRICSERAKIGFVFARRGIINEACSSYFLPKVVGYTKALEWLMLGRTFTAAEGKEAGLFTQVVPPEEVLPAARALAQELAGQSAPVSAALARAMVWHSHSFTHPIQAHDIESKAMFYTARQEDAKEGVAAFLEKRAPQWRLNTTDNMPDFYPWWETPPFREKGEKDGV